jgi:diguanylate cyclase (GGDEF)-like protein
LAERIRQTIEDLAIPHAASEAADHVTVSLGVVTVSFASDLITPEQIVAMADTALYNAKREGRNRYIFQVSDRPSS